MSGSLRRLYLINPSNPLVSMVRVKQSRWQRYRIWKPLGLLVLAGLTPPEWEITIIDENVERPDYSSLPRPDLVGITAFTSQATRAYDLAAAFREMNVPVVMGGIHATMCVQEASARVDSVVTGEAESVWAQVLDDARTGQLKPRYDGGQADISRFTSARHDLLPKGYAFGSVQTTRGCPLNCSFCSVSTFNGVRYRQRSIPDVVKEFQMIREKYILVVDDNLIGTRPDHIIRAKELFRALAAAKLRKNWVAQVTINFADDEELLALAAKAGCSGVFIGFESTTPEGLREVGKNFNLLKGRDFRDSVRRIQRHGIVVVGSFIIGLDSDQPGVGNLVAKVASHYGVDILNAVFLTPLPGTRLYKQMSADGRIALGDFPKDWKYYTFMFPVAQYKNFSHDDMLREMTECNRYFYSRLRILWRVVGSWWRGCHPLINLVSNFSYRYNLHVDDLAYIAFQSLNRNGDSLGVKSLHPTFSPN